MTPPPFLAVAGGKGAPFRLKRSRFRKDFYRLEAEGSRFSLAAGPMGFLMKHYRQLAQDHLKRTGKGEPPK